MKKVLLKVIACFRKRMFKSGDFDLPDKELLGQPKNLKMNPWRLYSIKITVKPSNDCLIY